MNHVYTLSTVLNYLFTAPKRHIKHYRHGEKGEIVCEAERNRLRENSFIPRRTLWTHSHRLLLFLLSDIISIRCTLNIFSPMQMYEELCVLLKGSCEVCVLCTENKVGQQTACKSISPRNSSSVGLNHCSKYIFNAMIFTLTSSHAMLGHSSSMTAFLRMFMAYNPGGCNQDFNQC